MPKTYEQKAQKAKQKQPPPESAKKGTATPPPHEEGLTSYEKGQMASTNQMQPTLKQKQETGPATQTKDKPQRPAPLSTKQSKIARIGKWRAEQLDKPKKHWAVFNQSVDWGKREEGSNLCKFARSRNIPLFDAIIFLMPLYLPWPDLIYHYILIKPYRRQDEINRVCFHQRF